MPSWPSAFPSLWGAQLTPPDRNTWCPYLSWPYYRTGTVVFLPYMSLTLSAKGGGLLRSSYIGSQEETVWREHAGIQPSVSNVTASLCTCTLTEGPSESHVSASELRSSQQQSNSHCTETGNSWMQTECQFGFRALSELHWTGIST